MSAAQFVERLFGELPALFKDEDELRAIWGMPDHAKEAAVKASPTGGLVNHSWRKYDKSSTLKAATYLMCWPTSALRWHRSLATNV